MSNNRPEYVALLSELRQATRLAVVEADAATVRANKAKSARGELETQYTDRRMALEKQHRDAIANLQARHQVTLDAANRDVEEVEERRKALDANASDGLATLAVLKNTVGIPTNFVETKIDKPRPIAELVAEAKAVIPAGTVFDPAWLS